MEEAADNRRQSVRVTSSQRCWCESGDVTIYAQMANLSEGGLFLRTLAPLTRGATTRVRFACGNATEVEAEAVVVWRREHASGGPAGMGLQFTRVLKEHLEQIRAFVGSVLGPDEE